MTLTVATQLRLRPLLWQRAHPRRAFGGGGGAFGEGDGAAAPFSTLEAKADGLMRTLLSRGETVGCAETSTGGLIAASLWSSDVGPRAFKGGGIRLAYGISREADARGRASARETAARWGIVYEDGVTHTETGSMEHALEVAHAAKFNLGTHWGIGESGVPGPEPHRRTGLPPGMGFVAVAGPTPAQSGVMKLSPSENARSRSGNMHRFANAALDLMLHLQTKPPGDA